MTDQAKEATVIISIPERFTLEHWETYTHARQDYIQKREDAGRTASAVIADYYGVLALIRAGYVHIKGTDEVADLLKEFVQRDDQSHTPTDVIGFLVREVARKVEVSMALPLVSRNGSSGTSTTQTTAPAQPS